MILDIYITGKCNFSCKYCYGEKNSVNDMNFEVFKKLVSICKKYDYGIGFTGGEPLLHSDFKKFVIFAKESGIKLYLHTNGVFLNDYFDILEYFEMINISIDGIEEVQDLMRPNYKGFNLSKYEKFIIPVNNIKKIQKNFSNKLIISTIATKKNYKYIPQLGDFFNREQISYYKWKIYQFTSNYFRSLTFKKEFEISTEELNIIEKSLKIKGHDVIIKYGEGNCILIHTNGNIRVNEKYLDNFLENELIFEQIKNIDNYKLVLENKVNTYE